MLGPRGYRTTTQRGLPHPRAMAWYRNTFSLFLAPFVTLPDENYENERLQTRNPTWKETKNRFKVLFPRSSQEIPAGEYYSLVVRVVPQTTAVEYVTSFKRKKIRYSCCYMLEELMQRPGSLTSLDKQGFCTNKKNQHAYFSRGFCPSQLHRQEEKNRKRDMPGKSMGLEFEGLQTVGSFAPWGTWFTAWLELEMTGVFFIRW